MVIKGHQPSGIGCDDFRCGEPITTVTAGATNWTANPANSYISFTSTEESLDIYFFISMQSSTSYTVTPSCSGATMEIVETPEDYGGSGKLWKMKLSDITVGNTITLNVYTSYSAVAGLGYMVI